MALALKALREGGQTVTIVWFDSRGIDDRCAFRLTSEADLDAIFRLFGTAPITRTPYTVADLSNLLEDNFDGATFAFVCGGLSDRLAASVTALELPNGARQEVYTFEPYEQIAESARPAYLDAVDAHREELLRYGITVHDLRETVLSREEVTDGE